VTLDEAWFYFSNHFDRIWLPHDELPSSFPKQTIAGQKLTITVGWNPSRTTAQMISVSHECNVEKENRSDRSLIASEFDFPNLSLCSLRDSEENYGIWEIEL
jgi:hypothetical protein